MNKKTILLTGATGFLGSHLLESFRGEKYNIIILERSFSNIQRIENVLNKVHYYNIDKIKLIDVFKENKIDIVIHTATNYGRKGEGITEVVRTNLLFPLKLLELCIIFKTNTFINTDTFLNINIALPEKLDYYVLSKKQFVEYGRRISNEYDLKFVNLRLEHMFGPRDDTTKFIPFVIEKSLSNFGIDLTKGEQKRDFIYIKDIVSAFNIVLKNLNKFRKNFHEIGIGTSSPVRVKDAVLLIKKICNSDSKLNFGVISYRKNEIMESKADISILKHWSWKPSFSLEVGVRETVKYYREKLR